MLPNLCNIPSQTRFTTRRSPTRETCNMETISLRWHGPFSFVVGDAPLIYGAPEANTPGVYLWTVPFEGRNYINYVGISVWSIAARNDEHMRCYLSGKYTFYKATPFARLDKQVAFDASHGLEAFLARYNDNIHELMNSLKCVRIYVAPLARDRLTLELVESGIFCYVHKAGEPLRSFLDNERPSRKVGEASLLLKIDPEPCFQGLPNELRV